MIRYAACLLLASSAFAKPVLEFDPLPNAPYSASATVHPDAALVFTRSYSAPGPDLATQASAALQLLAADLAAAGLELSQVANVRGYLKSAKGRELDEEMAAWSRSFSDAFAASPEPPTRTTIGVSDLLDTESLIAIDAILAVPQEATADFSPLLSNARIAGPPSAEPADLRSIAAYSTLLVTSGVLADPLSPNSREFGPQSVQTASTLAKLETTLRRWGLGVGDLAFVRVMLSPQPSEDGADWVDTAGFAEAWQAFWHAKRVQPPPFSAFAATGFSASGRIVEIEFYAAFPEASGPFATLPTSESEPLPAILREGSEASFLSSSVAIARDAKKVWFSGVISRDRDTIYGQGVEALLTLEERMERVGIQFPDTAQLRAYLNFDGPFGPNFGLWNNAYKRFFDHPKLNPDKPARTAFPIENLPGGAQIEIETLAAKRD